MRVIISTPNLYGTTLYSLFFTEHKQKRFSSNRTQKDQIKRFSRDRISVLNCVKLVILYTIAIENEI